MAGTRVARPITWSYLKTGLASRSREAKGFPVAHGKPARFATGFARESERDFDSGIRAGFVRESERELSGGCDGNRDGIESGNPAGDLRRDSQRDARRETSGISTGIVRGKGAGFQPGSERGFYRERAWGKGATVAGQRAGDPCGGLRGGSSGIVRANTR